MTAMSGLPRVTNVEVVAARTLRVFFSDGLVRELDFATSLIGFLAVIDDDTAFAAVEVDPVSGTVSWPTGVDFDPDVLRGEAPAAVQLAPKLIREYRIQHSA